MKTKETMRALMLILILISLISLFYFLKLKENPAIQSYDQYYDIGIMDDIQENGMIIQTLKDNFVPPLDYLISFTNFKFMMRLLPFFFGLINILLLYNILRKTNLNETHRFFILLAIILSPTSIFLVTTYTSLFLFIFFSLSAILLLMADKYLFGGIMLILAFIASTKMFIILFLLLIVLYYKFKGKNMMFPFIGISAITFVFILINNTSLPKDLSLYFLLTNYISDMGAVLGIGIFSLMLGCFGIAISWRNKKENLVFYYALMSLAICMLFDTSFVIFFDMLLSYFLGTALFYIWKSEWESETLKSYVVLLVFCGLIFSVGSYINRTAHIGPTEGELISMQWMKENINDEKIILSDYEYGYLITAMSNLKPFTDKRYYLYSKDKTKINQSYELFNSRNLKNIVSFFENNKIGYIWINIDMKHGKIWSKEGQGFLFVLDNSPKFQKIYDYSGVEIWKYMN